MVRVRVRVRDIQPCHETSSCNLHNIALSFTAFHLSVNIRPRVTSLPQTSCSTGMNPSRQTAEHRPHISDWMTQLCVSSISLIAQYLLSAVNTRLRH